jgi:hypothetical protein
MSSTDNHTAKCLRCGRVRRFRSAEAAANAAPHGRICAMRVRLAAMTEAVKGFAATAIEKAQQLIADGGIIPSGRKGIMRAVSSTGDGTYLVTAAGQCNCIAALRSGKADRCYHTAAARLLVAAGKAA